MISAAARRLPRAAARCLPRATARRLPRAALVLGLLLLYAPIAVLVVLSFNRSPLEAVWAGASTRWYAALFRDGAVLRAASLSLMVALLAATISLLVGVPAAIVLARARRFRGRALFAGLIATPLVLPDIILGISLLLLFTSLKQAAGWPAGRGVLTIVIGHVTLCSAFVVVVVQGRLARLDKSLEEAASDLGANPITVVLLVTLPLLAPALISAWLLAFSLSLDDVVIASFLSGPGSTTLPVLLLSKVRLGVNPEVNALATLVILVVGLAATAAALATRRFK